MKVPRVDLTIQEAPLKSEILRGIKEVIDSTDLILGAKVRELEGKIASYIGVEHCLGVASGTDAMTLSLSALGVKKGDEVITTPFTMAANVEAIIQVGATPVFADVNQETFNIVPEKILEKVSKKTRAILPVHLFGCPAEMKQIMEIAEEKNLFVVEDCAQSFGAEFNRKKCGSFGSLNATSFYPTKNLGCYGDGGMIFINDAKYLDKLTKLRVHGQKKKYIHEFVGWNSRLDEIQAAVLLPKLRKIDGWNLDRGKAASAYRKNLKGLEEISLPVIPEKSMHVFHLYTIKADRRDALEKHLAEKGIGTTVNFPLPLHLQEAYSFLKYKRGDYPDAEALCRKSISIPLFVGITGEQIKYVSDSIREFYS